MEISVREVGYKNDLFDLTIESGSARITETCNLKELQTIAKEILEDAVFSGLWGSEFVGKLIEMGVITHEQVLEYAKDSEEEEE